jgi:hypothetical protein
MASLNDPSEVNWLRFSNFSPDDIDSYKKAAHTETVRQSKEIAELEAKLNVLLEYVPEMEKRCTELEVDARAGLEAEQRLLKLERGAQRIADERIEAHRARFEKQLQEAKDEAAERYKRFKARQSARLEETLKSMGERKRKQPRRNASQR